MDDLYFSSALIRSKFYFFVCYKVDMLLICTVICLLLVCLGLFGFGFLTGIASYQSACVEKIMKLENSRLADQVRARML